MDFLKHTVWVLPIYFGFCFVCLFFHFVIGMTLTESDVLCLHWVLSQRCRFKCLLCWGCKEKSFLSLLSVRGDQLSRRQAVYSVRHPVSGSFSLRDIHDMKQQKTLTYFYSFMTRLRNVEWQPLRVFMVLQSEKPKLPNSPNCIRRESHILNVISICFYIFPLHRILLLPFHNYSSCYWYWRFRIALFISQIWLTI